MEENTLRGFVARILGWSPSRANAVEHAVRSIELAVERHAALVLLGDADLVPIAYALHRRTLGTAPFVVCNQRRFDVDENVRSSTNYTSGVIGFTAAKGGTLVLSYPRVPRDDPNLNLAPRSIYNIYSVVSAMFRDAKLADLIEQSPCVLDERHLAPLIDKDPEWRSTAVFTHEEAETIISDARIPADRQMAYAIELLAGVRPGEGSALRWRHYDPTVRPLGKLLVAKSYSTRRWS